VAVTRKGAPVLAANGAARRLTERARTPRLEGSRLLD
jgi:hypothetical protein